MNAEYRTALEEIVKEINKITEVNEKGLYDFNGHFWVEFDDGTIYDDYDWDDKEDFRKYFGIKNNNTLEYEKCPNFMTHKIVMTMLDKMLTQGGLPLEEAKQLMGDYWVTAKRCCMFNATANQNKKGGKVVFGCVYMNSDCGKKRRYICGGENFSTWKDYKKEYDYLAR